MAFWLGIGVAPPVSGPARIASRGFSVVVGTAGLALKLSVLPRGLSFSSEESSLAFWACLSF